MKLCDWMFVGEMHPGSRSWRLSFELFLNKRSKYFLTQMSWWRHQKSFISNKVNVHLSSSCIMLRCDTSAELTTRRQKHRRKTFFKIFIQSRETPTQTHISTRNKPSSLLFIENIYIYPLNRTSFTASENIL